MNHDNPNHLLTCGSSSSASPGGGGSAIVFSDVTGKSKTSDEFNEQDAGVDELLVVLGYKVKSSDTVADTQKIEHLEGVFNDDGLSQIAFDSVHHKPSDLSSKIE